MDARTEHLIAMVKDGATLKDAASVYGISGERVRQLLKEGGMRAGDLPGRAKEPGGGHRVLPGELAPVIEAMWREGMLFHEIARVFEASCKAVRRTVCERVPQAERAACSERRLGDPRPPDERLLHGLRRARSALEETGGVKADDRCRAEGVISGWLAAHSQLTPPRGGTSRPERGPSDRG